jgi:hypothetical protein
VLITADTEQNQANGYAEALKRILENKLHPILLSSELADVYWHRVVNYGISLTTMHNGILICVPILPITTKHRSY